MADTQSTVQKLRGDERGAIMVIAVFMSAFLVGALWYLGGIGQAALYKEQMQSGADAGAFAGAVFHARGMNIIALINIVMSAILAVLVALRVAYVLLTIAYAILYAISLIVPWGSWAAPIATSAQNAANSLNNFIKNVAEPAVDKSLTALSFVEKGVAKVIPPMAVLKTNSMAKKYNQPVEGGLMLSYSIDFSGGKFGLPVTEDKYSVLCDRSAKLIKDLIAIPLGPFGEWVGGLIEGMVSMAPSYFCGSCDGDSAGGGDNSQTKSSASSTIAKTVCDQKKKAYDSQKKKKDKDFDYANCMKDETKTATKDLDKNLSSNTTGSSSNNCKKTPKKVIDEAQNGDMHFQVMAFAWGNKKIANKGSAMVKVAAWGKKQTLSMPAFVDDIAGRVHFGQAEYYYEPGKDSGTDWASVKEDSMWNMRWRARLRHYHEDIAPAPTLVKIAMTFLSIPSGMDGIIEKVNQYSNVLSGGGLLGGGETLSDIYTKQAKDSQGGFDKVDTSKAFDTKVEH